jgi:hypothetical protein
MRDPGARIRQGFPNCIYKIFTQTIYTKIAQITPNYVTQKLLHNIFLQKIHNKFSIFIPKYFTQNKCYKICAKYLQFLYPSILHKNLHKLYPKYICVEIVSNL